MICVTQSRQPLRMVIALSVEKKPNHREEPGRTKALWPLSLFTVSASLRSVARGLVTSGVFVL